MKTGNPHSFNLGVSGFTLIELMVTLTVLAVLMSLAGPGIRSFILNSRLVGPANDLVHGFQYARTEAIKHQLPVAICASTNPDDQAATCSYGTYGGWIAFVDTNGDWQRNAGEEVLKSHSVAESSVTLKTNNDGIVVYSASGFLSLPGAVGRVATTNITICDSRGNVADGGPSGVSVARAILIDAGSGRPRESKLISDVTAAGGC